MNNVIQKKIIIALVIVLVLSALPIQFAYAGLAGQQLLVTNACKPNTWTNVQGVRITGYNQNGYSGGPLTTWTGQVDSPYGCSPNIANLALKNYWWWNLVTITVKYYDTQTPKVYCRQKKFNVPRTWGNDWYKVDMTGATTVTCPW